MVGHGINIAAFLFLAAVGICVLAAIAERLRIGPAAKVYIPPYTKKEMAIRLVLALVVFLAIAVYAVT